MANMKLTGETFGARLSLKEFQTELIEIVKQNAKEKPRNKLVPCLWGDPGIGKTEVIKGLDGMIIDGKKVIVEIIPVGSFSEMGDLLGMPEIKEGRTCFAVPELFPGQGDDENYYVVVFDDLNRCGNNILQGLMHFFQTGELGSYRAPKGATIVATCNPQGGEEDTNALDIAKLTRLTPHFNTYFDMESWTDWAFDNGTDTRIIEFVRENPDLLKGDEKLCTARTINKLNTNLKILKDWDKEPTRLKIIATSHIGEIPAATFVAWAMNIEDRIDLSRIVDSKNKEELIKYVISKTVKPGRIRTAALTVTCLRIMRMLTAQTDSDNYFIVDKKHMENFVNLLTIRHNGQQLIPNDILFNVLARLTGGKQSENGAFKVSDTDILFKNPEMVEILQRTYNFKK